MKKLILLQRTEVTKRQVSQQIIECFVCPIPYHYISRASLKQQSITTKRDTKFRLHLRRSFQGSLKTTGETKIQRDVFSFSGNSVYIKHSCIPRQNIIKTSNERPVHPSLYYQIHHKRLQVILKGKKESSLKRQSKHQNYTQIIQKMELSVRN